MSVKDTSFDRLLHCSLLVNPSYDEAAMAGAYRESELPGSSCLSNYGIFMVFLSTPKCTYILRRIILELAFLEIATWILAISF